VSNYFSESYISVDYSLFLIIACWTS